MSYKDDEIYKKHKTLGFPKISKEEQLKIIETLNYDKIFDLVPEWRQKGVPMGLLREYITITKQELKEYFKGINFVKSKLDTYSPTYDGFWVRQISEGYEFFQRERGTEFAQLILKSSDEVIDAFIENVHGIYCK